MADLQPRSDALWILGGVGLIGLVAYMATRHQAGNTLQPTPPASTTTDTSQAGGPTATNTMLYDTTALPDPLAGQPAPASSAMGAPAQYVTLPSGGLAPFVNGIEYVFGSIIHYADGTAVQIGPNGEAQQVVTP